MEIPNSVRYFQRLNEMVKELAKEFESEKKGEKMPITKEVIVLYTDDGMGNSIGEIVGEVVRCKDCKKYIPCQKLPIGTSKWCDLFDRATCEMNYCGWGERREDAETD